MKNKGFCVEVGSSKKMKRTDLAEINDQGLRVRFYVLRRKFIEKSNFGWYKAFDPTRL